MEPSRDEAVQPPPESDAMSAQRPPDPGDRPRMAEALASLKEGLRDTADPLYDGWKRRPKVNPADPRVEEKGILPPPAAPPQFVPRFKPQSAEDPGVTIDLSREGTPDETPIGDVELTIDEDFGDTRPTDDDLDTEEAFFADGQANEMASAPPVARHSSVQADTVRVRVIRYPSFPRWALVVAAALVLFAVCILALRPTWLSDGEAVAAAGDVAIPPAPTSKFEPPVFEAQTAIPEEKEDLAFAAPADEKIAEKEERNPVSAIPVRPAMGRPTVAPIGSAVQVKIPAATRRRSGSRDFFRDPGF